MSAEIQSKIDFYKSQAQTLLNQFQQLHSRHKAPVPHVAQEVIGEFGGSIGESLLDSSLGRRLGKKFTKSYLAQQGREQLAAEEQAIERSLTGMLDGLTSFLSTVSVKKRGLELEGNSYELLNRLEGIREKVKLETRLNRIVVFLESLKNKHLVFNSAIPQIQHVGSLNEDPSKPYDILRRLENVLRTFIQTQLERISSNWWKECVPDDSRRRAEERKLKREKTWPWSSITDTHPVFYLDFTDYIKIITRENNWSQTFSLVFKDKEIISVKLRELEPIRNSIAHSRDLGRREVDKLRLYTGEILAAIERL